MLTFANPVIGGVQLTRPAMQAPGYRLGSFGWTVNQDGSAEFNNVIIRGTVLASVFQGSDFVIDSAGIFFY